MLIFTMLADVQKERFTELKSLCAAGGWLTKKFSPPIQNRHLAFYGNSPLTQSAKSSNHDISELRVEIKTSKSA